MLYRAGEGALAHGRKAMVGAFAGYVGRIGADPGDADDVHMRKALISGAALAVTPLAFLWTGFLAAFGEIVAAAVPFSYAALTLLGLLIFAITRQHLFIIGLQLTLWLVLPFVLSAVLGGFAPSGAVLMWTLSPPLAAGPPGGPPFAGHWLGRVPIPLLSGALLPPRPNETKHPS